MAHRSVRSTVAGQQMREPVDYRSREAIRCCVASMACPRSGINLSVIGSERVFCSMWRAISATCDAAKPDAKSFILCARRVATARSPFERLSHSS